MAGAGAAEEGEAQGVGGAGGGQDGCECAVYGEEVTGYGEEVAGEGDLGIGWYGDVGEDRTKLMRVGRTELRLVMVKMLELECTIADRRTGLEIYRRSWKRASPVYEAAPGVNTH